MEHKIIKLISGWFVKNKRDLPWRSVKSPYAIWISETMLQQTQVSVVIPYFERWMDRFPTLEQLASAELSEVIKMWEGLGYYRRAKMLHEGAKKVLSLWKGALPSDPDLLSTIPGIGPYTAGAIQVFAFNKKAFAIDGNVERVLCRLFGIEGSPKSRATRAILEGHLELLVSEKDPRPVSEGLIELGALICTKKPNCSICPLQRVCYAAEKKCTEDLPQKAPRAPITPLFYRLLIRQFQDRIIVELPKKEGRFGQLHTFPKEELFKLDDLAPHPCAISLPLTYQSVTRFKVTFIPWLIPLHVEPPLQEGEKWVFLKDLDSLALSSGERAVKNQLKNHLYTSGLIC